MIKNILIASLLLVSVVSISMLGNESKNAELVNEYKARAIVNQAKLNKEILDREIGRQKAVKILNAIVEKYSESLSSIQSNCNKLKLEEKDI